MRRFEPTEEKATRFVGYVAFLNRLSIPLILRIQYPPGNPDLITEWQEGKRAHRAPLQIARAGIK
jgi:hypothetical protein